MTGLPRIDPSVLLGLIARRHDQTQRGDSEGAQGDVSLERPLNDPAALPEGSVLGDFLSSVIDRIPPDEIADPDAFARAREILLRRGTQTIAKARRLGPAAEFAPSEIGAMEAVIRTDGSRPSLMLRNGAVPPNHPFIGSWRGDLVGGADLIARISSSVGRIEPARGTPNAYFGTGFVIDAGRGIVLTNRHVLEDMWRYLREFGEEKHDRLCFLDGAYINFAAEIDSGARQRFRIVEGRFVGSDGAGNERLDAAILRIRALTQAEAERERSEVHPLPRQLDLTDSSAGPLGQLTSCCVIGFPGRVPPPGNRGAAEDNVDWNWVTYELMGGRHGVKRIAPGLVHRPLGQLADDPKGWCFGHDATTLGGNSGSPVIAWKDKGEPVFGLHFAGLTTETNYAHAVSEVKADIDRAISGF